MFKRKNKLFNPEDIICIGGSGKGMTRIEFLKNKVECLKCEKTYIKGKYNMCPKCGGYLYKRRKLR